MASPRSVLFLALGLLSACGGASSDPAAEPAGWPEQACPSGEARLAWRVDGREPIAGSGQAFAVGDRVLVRGEQPGQVGWYEVERGDFQALPDPPTLRSWSTAAVEAGDGQARLHVLGGFPAPQHPDGAFQAYDLSDGVWKVGTSLPEARAAASAVVDQGSLLVFGGLWTGASGASSLVYRYELSQGFTGTWQELDAMPEPRARATAVVRDRRVYLVGGDYGNFGTDPTVPASSPLVYDLDEKTWSTLPALPTPRSAPAVAWLCGRMVVAGGRGMGGSPSDSVEAFDPVTQSWAAWPPLPERRSTLWLVEHRGALVSVASETLFPEKPARLVSTWSAAP